MHLRMRLEAVAGRHLTMSAPVRGRLEVAVREPGIATQRGGLVR